MFKIRTVILCILALLVIALYNFPTDEAIAEANFYCKMVNDGHWPDYKGNYKKFCIDDKWNGK